MIRYNNYYKYVTHVIVTTLSELRIVDSIFYFFSFLFLFYFIFFFYFELRVRG